jgi:crotonobetainyl-CoA:carnitine CoA-transferase CaiB-like acyl-CoA transferase
VPCGPINGIDSVFDDIQVQARGMRVEMAHPLAGRVPLVANPIRMSESPVSYRLAPPLLRDDSDAIVSDWLNQDR